MMKKRLATIRDQYDLPPLEPKDVSNPDRSFHSEEQNKRARAKDAERTE